LKAFSLSGVFCCQQANGPSPTLPLQVAACGKAGDRHLLLSKRDIAVLSLKQISKLIACLIAVALISAICYFAVKRQAIARFDRLTSEIVPGESAEQVEEMLGRPHVIRNKSKGDLFPLDPNTGTTMQYVYFVDTFFLPIVWIIDFDENSKALRTHRLD
jgi:hypothetical protein